MRPRASLVAATLAGLLAGGAHAQSIRSQPRPTGPRPTQQPQQQPEARLDDATDLRARFGAERAGHLLRGDAAERLRGVERAAALKGPEALALLVQQVDTSARLDGRALIATARGLAARIDEAQARSALIALANLSPKVATRERMEEDPSFAARVEIARRMASLALVQSGDAHALDAMETLARTTGVGSAGAMAALVAFPPSGTAPLAPKPMTAGALRVLARTGDRRALEGALVAAKTGDAETRAAALEALAALADTRAISIAAAALDDADPRVRVASTTALVTLGAPEAARAVEALVADDATAVRGIELARQVHTPGIVRALSARAAVVADRGVRAAAVSALGRDATGESVEALATLVKDPMLQAEAAEALARSPSAAAMRAIEALAATPEGRRLAVRAYVVRAAARGETSPALAKLARELAGAKEARDRAVGAFALVAVGETDVARWLDDPDPQVRREAALASSASPSTARDAALLARLAREEDGPTRTVLAAGLEGGDPSGLVPTRDLVACVRAGDGDAPLCALAFAARATPADEDDLLRLVASRDPVVRTHVARGLARSAEPTRAGRLAEAYAYEPDAGVRRALLRALAGAPRNAARFSALLSEAARLDPDAEARWTAGRVLAGRAPADEAGAEIAWVRLVDASGAPPPPGATGSLVRSDGLAVPVVFDADGDALVPGVPSGDARLVLAPRADATYPRGP